MINRQSIRCRTLQLGLIAQASAVKGAAEVIKKAVMRPQVATALYRQAGQEDNTDSSHNSVNRTDPRITKFLNRTEDCDRLVNISATCNLQRLQPIKPATTQQDTKNKPWMLERAELPPSKTSQKIDRYAPHIVTGEMQQLPLPLELKFAPPLPEHSSSKQSQGLKVLPQPSDYLEELSEDSVTRVLPMGWDGKTDDMSGTENK
jgi:hypothetical protein